MTASGYETGTAGSGTGLMAVYFDALARGVLLTSRCGDCRAPHFPPRPVCPHCGAGDAAVWEPASGRGSVWATCTFWKKYLSDFEDPPYLVVVVELEEGTRLLSTVVDVDREDVVVGMTVTATFVPGEARVRFTPSDAALPTPSPVRTGDDDDVR